LEYFSLLNGVPKKHLSKWFEKIKAFGLINDEMMTKYPSDLSGGMKRRLSVAISMCGDADVLLLDEPSTGLDPKNRHSLWDSIRNIRKQKGKSIILSTHSMLEADALSDRIGSICFLLGILKEGHLVALGTKSTLNARYGNKIKLNVVLILPTNEEMENRIAKFQNLVKSNLCIDFSLHKRITCPRNHGMETHIYLSFEMEKSSPRLHDTLRNLNSFFTKLNISEWDINESTSEDVFFNVLKANKFVG
jgi:ABC-type multidrug transport system ATPase subunit